MNALIVRYRPAAAITILVILYTVGLVGLHTDSRAWFLAATPLTLVISAALLVWNHQDWNLAAVAAMVSCVLGGYAAEVIGVQGGWLFGEYAYGATLGLQWMQVPLVIGLNWLLLAYATGTLWARLRVHKLLQAAGAAATMTLLDVLIEPVAMRLDFWQWAGDSVPLRNFGGWLLVSFVLLTLFQYLRFEKGNPVAAAVLGLQFVFFGTLNLTH